MDCKGSKRCLQVYLSDKLDVLERAIKDRRSEWKDALTIEWLGPKNNGGIWDWKELSGDAFWEVLGIDPQKTRNFWPSRGPHWDAVARLTFPNDSFCHILFEAKANVSELKSYLRAGNEEGQKTLIEKSLNEYSLNLKGYYQTCNRLAHLNFLRREYPDVNVSLCYLYFVNDNSHIKTERNKWDAALTRQYEAMNSVININPDDVFNAIFLDASDINKSCKK